VRICLMIEGQEGVTWDDWLALARVCEESGLEGLFRSDHYSSWGEKSALDAWTVLAALAARTERIRLGTLVSPVTFRHPSALAKSVVTVDHISGGRAELGMGAGWMEKEHAGYGFPFPDTPTRMEMLAEQAEIVVRQWTEEEFSFDGRHYRLESCRAEPKPVQRPHPPLIIGGQGSRGTIEVAARWADEYNTFSASLDQLRERRAKLDAACERLGRDPLPLSLMTTFVVGTDRGRLLERVRAMLGDRDIAPEEWLESRRDAAIAGTVDEVIERLRVLEDAGVRRVFLQHLVHDDLDTIRLVGAEMT
jgi:F420-dependent oxidoreductase-like protein